MKIFTRIILSSFLLLLLGCKNNNIMDKKDLRWSEERINRWYENQPWLVGANFITSSSINQLEFWQEETFNQELIDKELELSASIGMNAHRVYLHDLLWEQDSLGFLNRINKDVSIKTLKIEQLQNFKDTNLCAIYPQIGKNLNYMKSKELDFNYLYKKIDIISNKYCKKGYFGFKKNINTILKAL